MAAQEKVDSTAGSQIDSLDLTPEEKARREAIARAALTPEQLATAQTTATGISDIVGSPINSFLTTYNPIAGTINAVNAGLAGDPRGAVNAFGTGASYGTGPTIDANGNIVPGDVTKAVADYVGAPPGLPLVNTPVSTGGGGGGGGGGLGGANLSGLNKASADAQLLEQQFLAQLKGLKPGVAPTMTPAQAQAAQMQAASMGATQMNAVGAQAAQAQSAPAMQAAQAQAATAQAATAAATPTINASGMSPAQAAQVAMMSATGMTPAQIQASQAQAAQMQAAPGIQAARMSPADQIRASQMQAAQLDDARQAQFRSQQAGLATNLSDVIAGKTPSVAELQMRQAFGQQMAQQQGLAAAMGRGGNQALAMRTAMNNTGQLGAQQAAASALLRAQEQATGRAQLGGVLEAARSTDVNVAAQNAQNQQGAGQFNAAAQQSAETLYAQQVQAANAQNAAQAQAAAVQNQQTQQQAAAINAQNQQAALSQTSQQAQQANVGNAANQQAASQFTANAQNVANATNAGAQNAANQQLAANQQAANAQNAQQAQLAASQNAANAQAVNISNAGNQQQALSQTSQQAQQVALANAANQQQAGLTNVGNAQQLNLANAGFQQQALGQTSAQAQAAASQNAQQAQAAAALNAQQQQGANALNATNSQQVALANAANQQGAAAANQGAALTTTGQDIQRQSVVGNQTLQANQNDVSAQVGAVQAQNQKTQQQMNLISTALGIGATALGGPAAGAVTNAITSQPANRDDSNQTDAVSDRRAKKDIEDVSPEDMNAFYRAARPQSWSYKGSAQKRVGPMAQDMEKSAVGKTMIRETPAGKAIDIPSATTAMLAMIADMGRRLEQIEGRR